MTITMFQLLNFIDKQHQPASNSALPLDPEGKSRVCTMTEAIAADRSTSLVHSRCNTAGQRSRKDLHSTAVTSLSIISNKYIRL